MLNKYQVGLLSQSLSGMLQATSIARGVLCHWFQLLQLGREGRCAFQRIVFWENGLYLDKTGISLTYLTDSFGRRFPETSRLPGLTPYMLTLYTNGSGLMLTTVGSNRTSPSCCTENVSVYVWSSVELKNKIRQISLPNIITKNTNKIAQQECWMPLIPFCKALLTTVNQRRITLFQVGQNFRANMSASCTHLTITLKSFFSSVNTVRSFVEKLIWLPSVWSPVESSVIRLRKLERSPLVPERHLKFLVFVIKFLSRFLIFFLLFYDYFYFISDPF